VTLPYQKNDFQFSLRNAQKSLDGVRSAMKKPNDKKHHHIPPMHYRGAQVADAVDEAAQHLEWAAAGDGESAGRKLDQAAISAAALSAQYALESATRSLSARWSRAATALQKLAAEVNGTALPTPPKLLKRVGRAKQRMYDLAAVSPAVTEADKEPPPIRIDEPGPWGH
jgi:hypothetical protein